MDVSHNEKYLVLRISPPQVSQKSFLVAFNFKNGILFSWSYPKQLLKQYLYLHMDVCMFYIHTYGEKEIYIQSGYKPIFG